MFSRETHNLKIIVVCPCEYEDTCARICGVLKRMQIIPIEAIEEDMETHELSDTWRRNNKMRPITDQQDKQEAKNQYFKKYKVLYTDGVNAWNPYSDALIPIKDISDYMITHYYFVFTPVGCLKTRRNILIRQKRLKKKLENTQERKCACGCGKIIPPEWSAKRIYYFNACKIKDYKTENYKLRVRAKKKRE